MTQRAADYKAIDAEVNRIFSRYGSDEVVNMLLKGKCVYGRINDSEAVTSRPQVRRRRAVVDTNYANGVTFRVPGNPILMGDLEQETDYTTAELGENTFKVLGEVADQEALHRFFSPVLEKAAEAQKAIYPKSKRGDCIMARLIEGGRIEEVVSARFEPGEDILKTLYDICREKNIRTGITLDDSGSAVGFTYQHFPINPKLCPTNVPIGTMHGKCEISLQGTIGTAMCNLAEGDTPDTAVEKMFPTTPGLWEGSVNKRPMVGCEYGLGTPCIHAHRVASNADYTICGHLIPGTRMASGDLGGPSHLMIIIAKISGVELQATIDHKTGFYQNLVRADE